ncbi:ABC transporter ATP-binding protein [Hyalangium minutum]|uniref:Transport ATP-binding protein CydC n=1 Tax=Hyalangium minutum TaxID=394096 RepID=A0A085WMG4_9BACT|nr:ABC transporter ATP-binding protein [Hyalangium minutum]KFE68877.1 Transport ATP-binding protein CydC [Hyalangium minutum]
MSAVDAASWPLERLSEAMLALGRWSGLVPKQVELAPPPGWLGTGDRYQLTRWIAAAGRWIGVDVVHLDTPYVEVDSLLRGAGPALLMLSESDAQVPRFLLLARGGRHKVSVLGPDLQLHALPLEEVRKRLCHRLESHVRKDVEEVLAATGLKGRRRRRAEDGLYRGLLGSRNVSGCWGLRPLPGSDFWHQAQQAGLMRRLGTFLGAHALQYGLWLVSWWLIGKAALEGILAPGWLLAWGLVLATVIPLRLLASWSGGHLAILVGTLLKQRLLVGALKLEPEEIRTQGTGQLLGKVLESQAVESLAISGGLSAGMASIELLAAGLLFLAAPSGTLSLALLVGTLGVMGYCAVRYWRARQRWTHQRLTLTHTLVENLLGHRTRIVQQPREQWHTSEDQALEDYLAPSRSVDRAAVVLSLLIPHAWLILGVAGLAPAFLGGAAGVSDVAVVLGITLLAYQSLRRFASGLINLSGAGIAWSQIRAIFQAAARPERAGHPEFALARQGEAPSHAVVNGSGLVYRYEGRVTPVLSGADLRIHLGERILLEGPSGGGKSTLGSVLAGLRSQESGLLLADGLDRHTLGDVGWARRIVSAPQFHENHVLTGTFAFNLLMGCEWPPRGADLQEAEALCHELGLGELLSRMPSGLQQQLGEIGWQLSHGERSRLFIARALLQKSSLVILDESFAALDPETLRVAMRCVFERAPSLLVIAHP